MMKKKTLICALIALILALGAALPSFAAELPLLNDEAGLLSDEEAAALETRLEEFSAYWESDVVILTLDSFDTSMPLIDFAERFFEDSGYGQGDEGNGVMLIISMAERDWGVYAYGSGGMEIFTLSGTEFIGEKVKEAGLSDGDYANAFNTFADWCDAFYEQAAESEPYDTENMPETELYSERESSDYLVVLAVSFGTGLLIALLVTSGMKRQLKSVLKKNAAADYQCPGSMQVLYSNEQFLHKNVTKVYHPPAASSSGTSSGSSSSGRSHGSSGKF